MSHRPIAILTLASLVLAGCAQADRVVFVTDTSLGINADRSPATVSVAYDRIEGYVAPRYGNGVLPPVVASINLGGTIFAPTISQTYATGLAAVRAVNPNCAPDAPNPPVATVDACPPTSLPAGGTVTDAKLAFFGTSTTVGIKLGYSTDPYPDSFVLGYKRKEFSVLPLGSGTDANGKPTDIYPSVLATIDANINTVGAQNTVGLQSASFDESQFFATGAAAETLASNPAVSKAFNAIVAKAAASSLSSEQQAQVAASVNAYNGALQKVSAQLPDDPTAFKAALPGYVAKAYPAAGDPMAAKLEAVPTKDALMGYLKTDPSTTELLASKNS
jgi:hypothetical protein